MIEYGRGRGMQEIWSDISEEGGQIVYYDKEHEFYSVFEIPMYGGEERFLKSFTDKEDAIDHAKFITSIYK